MRRILATSLLLPSLLLPAVANASTTVDDVTAPTPVRVSTGVTSPVLVDSAALSLPQGLSLDFLPSDAQVSVAFTIDTKGQPQDIHVTKSLTPFWDARVVDAVSQFRYRPGTVSHQPVAVDMNLIVNIAR